LIRPAHEAVSNRDDRYKAENRKPQMNTASVLA
jgi:hypothetical protein